MKRPKAVPKQIHVEHQIFAESFGITVISIGHIGTYTMEEILKLR